MRLRGYRTTDAELLDGGWDDGDLLGLSRPGDPAGAATSVPTAHLDAPHDASSEVCVAPGVGVVRFGELDWINRRASVEIGVRAGAEAHAPELVRAAVRHGFDVLNLHRLHGRVAASAGSTVTDALADAGFVREATVPAARWHDGAVAVELWGAVRADR